MNQALTRIAGLLSRFGEAIVAGLLLLLIVLIALGGGIASAATDSLDDGPSANGPAPAPTADCH